MVRVSASILMKHKRCRGNALSGDLRNQRLETFFQASYPSMDQGIFSAHLAAALMGQQQIPSTAPAHAAPAQWPGGPPAQWQGGPCTSQQGFSWPNTSMMPPGHVAWPNTSMMPPGQAQAFQQSWMAPGQQQQQQQQQKQQLQQQQQMPQNPWAPGPMQMQNGAHGMQSAFAGLLRPCSLCCLPKCRLLGHQQHRTSLQSHRIPIHPRLRLPRHVASRPRRGKASVADLRTSPSNWCRTSTQMVGFVSRTMGQPSAPHTKCWACIFSLAPVALGNVQSFPHHSVRLHDLSIDPCVAVA